MSGANINIIFNSAQIREAQEKDRLRFLDFTKMPESDARKALGVYQEVSRN
jgi:hypothetical protein